MMDELTLVDTLQDGALPKLLQETHPNDHIISEKKHNSKADCKPLLTPKGHGRRQDFLRRDNLGHA